MKKFIIATFTGAVITFAWSAISWMALPIHNDTFKKADNEEETLNSVTSSLPEDGAYMVPNEEMDAQAGKPFAMIFYVKEMTGPDAMQFIIGFLFDLIMAAAAVTLIAATSGNINTFFMRFWVVMIIALFQIMVHLTYCHWMGFAWHFVKGSIFDTFASWSLAGLWYAWYLGRK